jgi:RNA polymerase sigma factor (sigma-70 family)
VTRLITGRLRRLGAYDLGDEWRDLCQEVVWALVRAVREGRAPQAEKVTAYVGAIVQNQLVTWLRKHKTHLPAATPALDDGSVPADDLASAVTDREAPGEREDRFAAKQALARLSRDWQALLVAHYVEGRTIDTLVAASGKSRATLNRELGRARSAFRAALMEDVGVAAAAEMAASLPMGTLSADEGEST